MVRAPENSAYEIPVMMGRLTAASWETIFYRTLMIAFGTCSTEEFRAMTAEKSAAMQDSFVALVSGQSQAAIIAPFLTRARANATRLRRASKPGPFTHSWEMPS